MTLKGDALRERLTEIIAEEAMIDREKLVPDATLTDELGFASYDVVMVLMAIEDEFGVYISVDNDLESVTTFAQLLDQLQERIESAPPSEGQDSSGDR